MGVEGGCKSVYSRITLTRKSILHCHQYTDNSYNLFDTYYVESTVQGTLYLLVYLILVSNT